MRDYIALVTREIEESALVTGELRLSCSAQIIQAAEAIMMCLRTGGKVIAFGNGGSAAEAQHFVAELVGRYQHERAALAALALTTDTASLTAIGNDYGFEEIFSRQLRALAKRGDVVVAISTSGNSRNVLRAIESAEKLGLRSIALTGRLGGKLRDLVETCIAVPSGSTPRIQEAHALIVHIICGIVEEAFIGTSQHKAQSKSAADKVR